MKFLKKEVIMQVENVSLTYDKPILRDINFDVHNITRPDVTQGQVISLIGRSGIGKTQLFKILAGMIQPDKGIVKIGLELLPVSAGEVGIVPQNYILFNHRTVYQNLKISVKNATSISNEKEQEELIKDYVDKFDLSEHLKKYPMQLSGGQRQRVSIIQQVLTGNRFILLDEPFSGLDALMIDKVINLLLRISTLHELNTLIIVSHDVENSLAISDTAFILAREKGKEQDGATITETLDLIGMGLAWDPAIGENVNFKNLVAQIKHKI